MTTLLLVRHGETDWNAGRLWQGHTDVPLNDRGRAQAAALAEELAADPPAAIYTSDLSRARETAEIVAARLGVPVIVEPRLREIDVGSREGLTAEEVGDRAWDGEPHSDHGARVLAAVRDAAGAHPGARILMVAHGGSLRRIQEEMGADVDVWFDNCVLWPVSFEDGVLRAVD